MKLFFVLLLFSLHTCVVFGQTGTDNVRPELLETYGVWGTGRYLDTFDDKPTSWFAGASQGDLNAVFFTCYGKDQYGFLAAANGSLLDGPTETKVRIDSNLVIDTVPGAGLKVFIGWNKRTLF